MHKRNEAKKKFKLMELNSIFCNNYLMTPKGKFQKVNRKQMLWNRWASPLYLENRMQFVLYNFLYRCNGSALFQCAE